MSDMPPGGPPPQGPVGFQPTPMPPGLWPPMMPIPMRRPSRWPTFATLLVSLLALGFAVAAWLRPLPEPSPPAAAPTFTDQQVADAKAKVCDAYGKVRHTVEVNEPRDGGDDPNAQLLVAVNGRQIMVSGSAFLLTLLSDEPATPVDLAAAVANFAKLYQVITINGLAGDRGQAVRDRADNEAAMIQKLCS